MNLRQKRWIELVEDYDCSLNYHPGKVNVVADALSRKAQIATLMMKELSLVEQVSEWNPRFVGPRVMLGNISVQSSIMDRIKEAQKGDPVVQKRICQVWEGTTKDYHIGPEGILRFGRRVVVPENGDLRKEVLEEAHRSKFTVHPGGTKRYQDLRQLYWWEGMKKDIAQFIQKCLVCQQVKAEHQKPSGLLQPLEIPEWKWDHVTMDFVTGLPRLREDVMRCG